MRVAERPPIPAEWPSASPRQSVGIVLVHGFNGTPGDMAQLAERLAARGYQTCVLQLPGHAGNLSEMETATWADWFAATRDETRRMLRHCDRVVVIGHSLGGALALAVAAAEPRIAGVVALCPPCQLRRGLPEAVDMLRRLVRYVPALRYDVSGPWVERWKLRKTHAYDWVPLATVRSLFDGLSELRTRLPLVRCPALVMCARHDHIVPMEDGVEAYARLGSARKELLVLARSHHLVLCDAQQELVIGHVARFCAEVAPLPAVAH